MKKICNIWIALIISQISMLSSYAYAQNGEVKGIMVDSISRQKIVYATISLLRPTDSSVMASAITNLSGVFVVRKVGNGKVLMKISHEEFKTEWIEISVDSNTLSDLGTISMCRRIDSLAVVYVIRHRPLVNIKGDTVEYNTADVKLKSNENVEDLLKGLPGVEVDSKGNIVVNGVKIEKILVDGEDLFSYDPTIVTRYLNANMISKIDVFNKKSAKSEFTGIDDGAYIKTLNLTIGADKRNDFFGKVDLGSDADKYYNYNCVAGVFHKDRKIAAYIMASNTGESSTIPEIQDNGEDDVVTVESDPEISDKFGESGGNGGQPKTISIGANYSNKWNGDGVKSGQHFSNEYLFYDRSNNATSYNYIQQIFPDSIFQQMQSDRFVTDEQRNSLSLVYRASIDSTSSFVIKFYEARGTRFSKDLYTDSTYLNNIKVNSILQTSYANSNNTNSFGNILWRKRFKRLGQSFYLYAGLQTTKKQVAGFLYSMSDYYGLNSVSMAIIDQKKNISLRNGTVVLNSVYTNPISKSWSIAFGYNFSSGVSHYLNSSWNNVNGKYNEFVDSLSSLNLSTTTAHKLNLTAESKGRRIDLTFGGDVGYVFYKQLDRLRDTSIQYYYLNLSPTIFAQYKISNLTKIFGNYFGGTQSPSMDQVEIAKNTNDPLNVREGNPGLRPAFNHKLRLGVINNFGLLSGGVFSADLSFGFIRNGISTSTYLDSLGRTITKFENVNGNRNISLNCFTSWGITALKMRLGFNVNANYSRTVNFTNAVRNLNDTYTPVMGFSAIGSIKEKFEFNLHSSFGYTVLRTSIDERAQTGFWEEGYTAEIGLVLPLAFDLRTSAVYNWRQRISINELQNHSLIWNVGIKKELLRNAIIAKVMINDILSQNRGFSDFVSANETVESNFLAISRYWIIAICWSVAKHKK